MTVFILSDEDREIHRDCRNAVLHLGFTLMPCPAGSDVVIAPLLRRILTPQEISVPHFGTLIFHPSLLPRHRGPDAIKWAFSEGERYTGVTWFWASEGLDKGDICEQEVVAIRSGETPRDFYMRAVIPAAVRTLGYALQDLANGIIRRRPQSEESATYESWFKSL